MEAKVERVQQELLDIDQKHRRSRSSRGGRRRYSERSIGYLACVDG